MNATQFASLADDVRKLPARSAGRDRLLYRLTDLYAAAEALGALQRAAARTGAGVVGNAFTAAADVLRIAGRDLLPEDAAAYDRLHETVVSPEFLAAVPAWIRELRAIASDRPQTGACTVATALKLWSWTMSHFRASEVQSQVLDELAESVGPLLAARALALELIEEGSNGTPADLGERMDLCEVYAAQSAARTGTLCAELVFGYRQHLTWDAEGCATCYSADALDELEAVMPGIASGAGASIDVLGPNGSHPRKAGPCATFNGVDAFMKVRNRLDGCLTGARLAKDRAAAAIARSNAAMTNVEGRA